MMTSTSDPAPSLVLPGMTLRHGTAWGGLTPRPHQYKALMAVLEKLRTQQSTLVNLFTGGGKSLVIGELARLAKGKVLILAERDTILDQLLHKIESMTGEDVEVEQAESRAWHSRIVIASKDSMKQDHRLERFRDYGFTLIEIDEAHHSGTFGYRKIVENFPDAKRVGFTATPTPACGRMFESVAFEYQLHEAMRDGWACPILMGDVEVRGVDISNVRRSGSDLNQEQVNAIYAVEENMLGMMGATYEAVGHRPTIVSATSIHNARRSAEILNRIAGKEVAFAIDSKDERDRKESLAVLESFRTGGFQFLCNVGKATEGFDAPATAAIAMCKPTLSTVYFKQTLGRGMRGGYRCPVPGKTNLLVLDFVQNSGRHDLVSVATILSPGSPADLHAGVMKRARKKHIDMLTALGEELEERKKRLTGEVEQRKFIVPRVDWRMTKVDPFTIAGITNPNVYVKVDDSGPPTQKQIDRLIKWKVDVLPNLTKRQAQKLIQVERERFQRGDSTYAQIKFGLTYGYDVSRCTSTRALMLFKEIWRNGGKSLPRDQAAAILMGRSPGED